MCSGATSSCAPHGGWVQTGHDVRVARDHQGEWVGE